MVGVPGAADGHHVRKTRTGVDVAHFKRVKTVKNSRDPHTQLRGGFHQIDLFVAGSVANLSRRFSRSDAGNSIPVESTRPRQVRRCRGPAY